MTKRPIQKTVVFRSKAGWLLHRLCAMSIKEVGWRLSQRHLSWREERYFCRPGQSVSVDASLFNPRLSHLSFDADTLALNLANRRFSLNRTIPLFGYDYEQYKTSWNSGFQTVEEWPLTSSSRLDYRRRDDIGDARTNWELNRHHQFALLAKDYYVTGDGSYLLELENLFNSWNEECKFLQGISWTSEMDIAIRALSWIYSLAFLKFAHAPKTFCERFSTGILNMVDHVALHYSRFSSANNHLLVEACCLVCAGIVYHHSFWVEQGVGILDEQLCRQNFPDGVNKEMSLHYQVFAMEAYFLTWRLLVANDLSVPAGWPEALRCQARYVSHCRGTFGEMASFGDDDEGKIVDLSGEDNDRIAYVCQFASLLLDERYDFFATAQETLCWLFDGKAFVAAQRKKLYDSSLSRCWKQGGVSLLKSRNQRFFIAIDHGPLGFGSLCAHGHADALSFQMFVDGHPLFIDPGTGLYHCYKTLRDMMRSTRTHNTLCLNGKDQSEMLGPFLWGRKAQTTLREAIFGDDGHSAIITAEHDGYAPTTHCRRFSFDGNTTLIIDDILIGARWGSEALLTFLLAPNVVMEKDGTFFWLGLDDKRIRFEVKRNDELVALYGFGANSDTVRNESDRVIGKDIDSSYTNQAALSIQVEKALCSFRYGCFSLTNCLKVHAPITDGPLGVSTLITLE